jgi:hypothetical protein
MKLADHRLWTEHRLIQILQDEAHRLGDRPRRSDFSEATVNRPHYRTFAYRFGSRTKALQAAALIGRETRSRELSGPPARISYRAALVSVLLSKCDELGRLPAKADFPRATAASPHYRTFASHFGSWTKVRIPMNPNTRYDVFEHLGS